MSGWQFDALIGNFVPTGGSGGGGGTIAGTIATNQIAFGTALDTIGGSANLTYNGTTAIVTGAGSSVTLFRVAGSSDTNYPFEVLGGIPGSFGAINTIARMSIAYIDDIGFSGWNFELYRDTSRGTGTPEGQAYDFNTGGPVGQSFTFTPDGSIYLGLAFDTTNSILSVGSTFDASVLATLRAANVILGNGGALQSDTTTAHTALIQAYDVDGAAYKTFGTLTNANTPSFALAAPSGGSLTGNFSTLQVGGTSVVLTSRSIATTSPLAGGGDLSADRTLTIADAAADGSTKGAATFTAADFNSSSGLISIDYANGQAASGAAKGFLTAADWTTFNNKGSGSVTSIATTSPISGGTITTTGTLSLLVNVDFGWTVGQTITAPAGATALTLAGGTQTSSFPVISATQTWSNVATTFTGILLNVTNTNSAAGSKLLDLQVGGVSLFGFSQPSGVATLTSGGSQPLSFISGAAAGILLTNSRYSASTAGFQLGASLALSWTNSATNGNTTVDLSLFRDATDTLAQRRTTNAQKFRLYNTFTTVDTAGEWFAIDWITTANVCNLQAVKGSSSGTARVLTLSYGGAQAAPVAAITIPITSGAITFGGGILLPAGAAGAGLAPLKFTSGTNLTTAEAGAMEYNGTNLFFTRAGTTRENVLVAVDNATAPTTTIGIGIVNFYGSSAANFLGDPNRWLSVNVLGTVYKIPLYT